ncbi:MAG: hypothetical protein RI911_15, partial [Candidatus Parcubacteria bacterium]
MVSIEDVIRHRQTVAQSEQAVHRETIRQHRVLAEKAADFFRAINWNVFSEIGVSHKKGGQVDSTFQVGLQNIVFEFNPNNTRIMGHNSETGHIICNLASKAFQAVINLPDGTPPTQKDIFALLTSMSHECAHAQGFVHTNYFEPPLAAAYPLTMAKAEGKRLSFGYGGIELLTIHSKSGEKMEIRAE